MGSRFLPNSGVDGVLLPLQAFQALCSLHSHTVEFPGSLWSRECALDLREETSWEDEGQGYLRYQ